MHAQTHARTHTCTHTHTHTCTHAQHTHTHFLDKSNSDKPGLSWRAPGLQTAIDVVYKHNIHWLPLFVAG